MSWGKDHDGSGSGGAGSGGRGYHHGNLREALIDAAMSLIAELGPSGFTFAEAARRAGVSPAAPYRHFRDRDALMAEVARRGFEILEIALTKAWNDGRPDVFTAFEALGRAYLDFARLEPAHYVAMFEADFQRTPEVKQAGDRAFEVLRAAAERLVATLPAGKRPPALMMALHVWVLAHGTADLFCRPGNRRHALPMEPGDLLEAAFLVYLQGLGFHRP
jgi:AcrR family transcriptional regulator